MQVPTFKAVQLPAGCTNAIKDKPPLPMNACRAANVAKTFLKEHGYTSSLAGG